MGALTSQPYRFRARPWDIEGAGSVCTLCPAQCNVTFTVRDERVLRVLGARPRRGRRRLAVRQGPLRLPVDPRRRAHHAADDPRRRRAAPGLLGARARRGRRGAARAPTGSVGAIAGGETTNEEGFLLQRLLREGLGSPDLDSRAGGDAAAASCTARSARPALQATVADLEFAHAVLVLDCEPVDDMPIVDLRIRKGVRRHGVKLAVATSRPSSLDPNAAASVRFAPGGGEAFVAGAGGRAAAGPARGGRPPRARPRAPRPTPCARWRARCRPARTS